jgi:hypothetical protein
MDDVRQAGSFAPLALLNAPVTAAPSFSPVCPEFNGAAARLATPSGPVRASPTYWRWPARTSRPLFWKLMARTRHRRYPRFHSLAADEEGSKPLHHVGLADERPAHPGDSRLSGADHRSRLVRFQFRQVDHPPFAHCRITSRLFYEIGVPLSQDSGEARQRSACLRSGTNRGHAREIDDYFAGGRGFARQNGRMGAKIEDRAALLDYLVVNFGDDKPAPPPVLTQDGVSSSANSASQRPQ